MKDHRKKSNRTFRQWLHRIRLSILNTNKLKQKLIMTGILLVFGYFLIGRSMATGRPPLDEKIWLRAKWEHSPVQLEEKRLTEINSRNDLDFFWKHHLKPILIERIPGTKNHELVRNHIIGRMKDLSAGWHIELDEFYDKPPEPYPETKFSSIIATLNPDAPRKLVLACHYESKIMDGGIFYAATDSAVPCAMLMNMAHVLDDLLKRQKWANPDLTIQLVFLDGEEAFIEWTDTDSIYGARHLAKKWKKTPYPFEDSKTDVLDGIDCFVLLDLLGGPNPQFQNHFKETDNNHKHMRAIESRLHSLGELQEHRSANQYFTTSRSYAGRISDDHIPFLQRGVRVLHWIATPFPKVWHKLSDNEQNLHKPTISNICKILNVFVAEYLHL